MKPEPLKNKIGMSNSIIINEEVAFAKDIKSAVEWLKNRMNHIISGDDFLNFEEKYGDVYFSKEQFNEWIDEAFEDVMK